MRIADTDMITHRLTLLQAIDEKVLPGMFVRCSPNNAVQMVPAVPMQHTESPCVFYLPAKLVHEAFLALRKELIAELAGLGVTVEK